MSTPDRYRTATLHVSGGNTSTRTCTDCGTLVLDVTTHDTWHTLQTATHLRDGDVLVLDVDFSTDAEGHHRINDLLTRLDIAHRTLLVGEGVTAQVLPRETLEPGPTERPPGLTSDTVAAALPRCPDCGHDARPHTGAQSGCIHPDGEGTCGCHRTAW